MRGEQRRGNGEGKGWQTQEEDRSVLNLADDSRFTRHDARDHAHLFHLQEKLVGKMRLERGQLVSSSQQRLTHQSRDVHHLQLSSANRLTG